MQLIFKEQVLQWNTILYCEHWDETIPFYRDILELPINHESDWFVEFKLTSDSYLSIAQAKRATIRSAKGNGITLSFRVKDIDLVHNAFSDLGLELSNICTVWGARAFFLYDPEGHRIELWSQGTTGEAGSAIASSFTRSQTQEGG
jgi:catechol 2,3-dioxygenase-like lactoylglutathione lyase family enzyme